MPEGERVVVAGAGFAGLNVAKGLEREAEVTLIAPTEAFVFLPLIHEVLGEKALPGTVTKPLDEILTETDLVYGRARAVEDDELVTAAGDRIPFDKLVVAIGAQPHDFGVPGVQEHALPFYSVGDALRANATLKHMAAELDGRRPLRVRIVGASFTGVEVAGEVADILDKLDVERDILLLDALGEIFPNQSDTFRQGVLEGLERKELVLETGQMITQVGPDELAVKGAEAQHTIPTDVTFWCAGVKPRTLEGVDPNVKPTLQSRSREDIFVVGDAANFPGDQAVPKLAQTAEEQVTVAVHNVLAPDDEHMMTYDPSVRGLIVSIGHGYAVAELTDGPVFKGRVPWHIKRNLYKAKIRMT